MDLFALLSSGLAFFIVAISPGPATVSNATIAMSHGRKTSFVYATGLSASLFVWGVIAMSGMGAILQTSVYLLMALKIFGGLYLLRLAFFSAKDAMNSSNDKLEKLQSHNSLRAWFMKGFVLNMSNPKSVLAWMAALSVGVQADAGFSQLLAGLLVCTFAAFSSNYIYSICFSFNGAMKAYQRFRRWVSGAVAGLFSIAGIGLIRSAFSKSPG